MAKKLKYDNSEEVVVKYAIKDSHGTDINISALNQNINNAVVSGSYSVTGDNGNLLLTKGSGTTQTVPITLANQNNAGLMSPSDVNSLTNLNTRVQQLEGQTIRLLYTASQNPNASQILAFVQSKGYTDPTKWASVAVVVQGTHHIWKFINDASVSGTWAFKNTLIESDIPVTNVNFTSATISFNSISKIDTGDWTLYYDSAWVYKTSGGWLDNDHKTIAFGSSSQSVSTQFLNWLIANTNTQGTYVYGYFQDFGVDVVTNFTNSSAGIIKGAGEVAGKVYAEADGTGSVFGWDDLTQEVEDLGTDKQNVLLATGSTTQPIYVSAKGTVSAALTYAGGTKVTLNGIDKGESTASFYAPTTISSTRAYLISNGTNLAYSNELIVPTAMSTPHPGIGQLTLLTSSNNLYFYKTASEAERIPYASELHITAEDFIIQ